MRISKIGIISILLSISFLLYSCRPDITKKMIEKDFVGREMGGFWNGWTFTEEEPRDIKILKAGYKDDEATIIIDLNTRSGGPSGDKYSGKIRLKYEWIGDDWDLIKIEDLTFERE